MNLKKIILIILFLGYKFLKPSKTEQTIANSVSDIENENIVTTPEQTLAEQKLSEMTLDEKIGQLFMVRPEAFEISTKINTNTRNYFKSISSRRNCFI